MTHAKRLARRTLTWSMAGNQLTHEAAKDWDLRKHAWVLSWVAPKSKPNQHRGDNEHHGGCVFSQSTQRLVAFCARLTFTLLAQAIGHSCIGVDCRSEAGLSWSILLCNLFWDHFYQEERRNRYFGEFSGRVWLGSWSKGWQCKAGLVFSFGTA